MNEYELLSSIYKILGESSYDVLQRVEEMGHQPEEILAIVRAFRNAWYSMNDEYKKGSNKDKRRVKKPVIDIGENVSAANWSTHAKKLWNSLQTTLSDAKKSGVTNEKVINAFVTSGLNTSARAKEGRPKILLSIQFSLEVIDDTKRINILQKVSGILGLSQTKGWMEVIKAGNDYINER